MNSMPESATNGFKIQKESAEEIFAELLEWYDIDEEDYKEEEDGERSFRQAKRKIVKAICKGYVELDKKQNKMGEDVLYVRQNFKFKYHKAPESITYREVNGRAKSAVRSGKDGDFQKMYKFLAALAGEEERIILQLKGVDNGLSESLGYLFLQV
jgi:hypothetical protein